MAKNEEIKGIVADAAESTAEVGLSVFLENLPELGAEVAQIIGDEAVSSVIQSFAGGVLGAIAPGFLGFKLSYQQKRFERNVLHMLKTINTRQTLIEKRLNALDPSVRHKFIDGSYRDVLLDSIVSENQEEKVQYNINGYLNVMAVENPNDDIVFTFFDTLAQMNALDIRVLRLYESMTLAEQAKRETFQDIIEEFDLDNSQYNFIREKLKRLGMLESKNEERRDANLDTLAKTVTDLIKQLYSKHPKEVKQPRLEKINRSDSYHISKLGTQYLKFIEDPAD